MHDTTLQAISVGVLEPEEGTEHAVLVVVTGLAFPMANPQTGEQLVVPDAQYRVPLQKAAIQALIDGLTQAAEALPDPKPQSNLVVPGSMQDADRVAQELGKFK